MHKLFSLIIVSYNNDSLLTRAFASIKDILNDNRVEVIIVDNGSKNNQSNFFKKHKNIKYIQLQKNIGPGGGRT